MLTTKEKNIIAQRIVSRAETGIYFVELDYLYHHKTPDLAWIRNIYILLSFYTELLLKGIFVYTKEFEDLKQLEKSLRNMGHDFEIIGRKIGKDDLIKFGITKITKLNPDYLVETQYGEFGVQDFVDVRYDFIDGKIRTIFGNEHILFHEQIRVMHKVINVLKPLIYESS